VLPLTARWPQAQARRAARRICEAQGLLDELAQLDLAHAATPSGFPWLACRRWSWRRWRIVRRVSAMHCATGSSR
jgi:hypothetical protein